MSVCSYVSLSVCVCAHMFLCIQEPRSGSGVILRALSILGFKKSSRAGLAMLAENARDPAVPPGHGTTRVYTTPFFM